MFPFTIQLNATKAHLQRTCSLILFVSLVYNLHVTRCVLFTTNADIAKCKRGSIQASSSYFSSFIYFIFFIFDWLHASFIFSFPCLWTTSVWYATKDFASIMDSKRGPAMIKGGWSTAKRFVSVGSSNMPFFQTKQKTRALIISRTLQ